MVANFYTFTKRRNSTLRPGGQGSYSVDVVLNDSETSLLAPAVRVQITSTGMLSCNYVHIPSFSRYYYINDWTYNADGTWTAALSVDALASWRDSIIASAGYVGRADAQYDNNIIDSMYPATTYCKHRIDSAATNFPWAPSNGLYVIGVISSNAPNVGVVSYYMVNHTEMAKLLNKMVSVTGADIDWSDIDSITGDVLKSIMNPIQYIVSLKWFPETRSFSSTDSIKLWGWDTTAKGARITDANSVQGTTFNITINDVTFGNDEPFSNYPRYAPYAQYTLITAWGTFELDANIIGRYRSLQVVFSINHVSGNATIIGQVIDGASRIELFRKDVQFAMDVPLSQISLDYVNIGKSAINAVGAAGNIAGWMTNPGGNAAAIASSAIDAVCYALNPSVQSVAGSGSAFSPEIATISVQQVRYATFEPDDGDFGKPLKRHYASLAALQKSQYSTGYVQLDHSEFAAACTQTEKDNIISALESGVFLE